MDEEVTRAAKRAGTRAGTRGGTSGGKREGIRPNRKCPIKNAQGTSDK